MAATDNFRSALHGFNRTDVVQFIEEQTLSHEKALRRQKEETERVQNALEEARNEIDRLNALNEDLTAKLEEAEKAPVPEEAPSPALDAPMEPVQTVVQTAPSNFNEMELAAYRRAEMTERMARERAEAASGRMKTIFSQADEKLEITQQDMSTLCQTFHHDFEQLQQILETARDIVSESSTNLKAAADVTDEI